MDFTVIIQSLSQGGDIMKLTSLSAVFGVLAICAVTAAAQSASLDQFRPKVLPVLVQVNAHGQITSASPAFELTPSLTRLLRTNLDEMINRPATDKQGRPMASQFVMNLAVQATPHSKGEYNVNFAYVSTSPVPAGSWYWVHIDGHRLALAPQHSGNVRQPTPMNRYQYPPDSNRSFTPVPTSPASQPINQAPLASQGSPARALDRAR